MYAQQVGKSRVSRWFGGETHHRVTHRSSLNHVRALPYIRSAHTFLGWGAFLLRGRRSLLPLGHHLKDVSDLCLVCVSLGPLLQLVDLLHLEVLH